MPFYRICIKLSLFIKICHKHKNDGTPLQHNAGEMEHLSSYLEQQKIQWRRDKVQEQASKGHSQRKILHILQTGIGTVNRDLQYLRQQAKDNIKKYIDERLQKNMRNVWLD